MSLDALSIHLVSTPSGLGDGHFPDGNDGTSGIPLIWASIPDFFFQTGTPVSINLISLYLTQPIDHSATVALHSGTLAGTGCTLLPDGTFAYDGIGAGIQTLDIRATRFGANVDSRRFTITSSAPIVNPDNQAGTIPTGFTSTAHTTTSISVTVDAPMDAPTATVPASGNKEIRFYVNGILNGTAACTGGKSVVFGQADVGGGVGSGARRLRLGHWVDLAGGNLPDPGDTSDAGPTPTDLGVVIWRCYWRVLEPSAGNYNFAPVTKQLALAKAQGKYLVVMIEGRTFKGSTAAQNPMPSDLAGKASTFTNALGASGWQAWWWDPVVVNRFNQLVARMGPQFNSDTSFMGIATQETAIGTPSIADCKASGYTPDGFCSAILSMSNAISGAFPNGRHVFFLNFLFGGGTGYPFTFVDVNTARKKLGALLVQMQPNGVIAGGPDLVTNLEPGNIVSRVYPLLHDYDAGVGDANNGTVGLAGRGVTFASVQSGEWTGSNAGDPNPNLPDLYNWATASFTYTTGGARDHRVTAGAAASPLNLPIIVWFYHTSGSPKWNPDFINILHAHPSFGTYVAPSSMAPGSLTQTGVDYDVEGAGTGIGTASDQWSVGRVQCNGNGTMIAKLNSITGADTSHAIAGLTIRDGTDSAARAAHLVVTTSQIRARYRGAPSAAVTDVLNVNGQNWSTPKWLKIVRSGTTFTYSYSLDGLAWTVMGNATIAMGQTVYAELFASSVTVATTVIAHFKQVNFQNLPLVSYTYTGLSPGVTYDLTCLNRDQAANDSAFSPILRVATG